MGLSIQEQLAAMQKQLAATQAENARLKSATSAFSGEPVVVLKTSGKLRITGCHARFEGSLSQAIAVVENAKAIVERAKSIDWTKVVVETKTVTKRNGETSTYGQVMCDGMFVGYDVKQLEAVCKSLGVTPKIATPTSNSAGLAAQLAS